jgi:two-component system, NtrC family, sensor kinase
MRRLPIKNLTVFAVALLLTGLGAYNIFLKATWTLLDDGVFWRQGPQGVVASRVAVGGPADRAGLRVGDVLLGVDGDEVMTPTELEGRLAGRHPGDRVTYSLLRSSERRSLELTVTPLPKGNVTLFYYLSAFGFFSLLVGTVVMLRRPPDRAALHFYAICLLFFLMYSTSYTGKLDFADWTLLWTDHLAILLLPVVFLHFCLSFPERKLPTLRGWLIPAAYFPALFLAGASVASQILFVTSARGELLWRITSAIDRSRPLYFAALFALSFGILLHSYRRTHGVTRRKQMKWLVWGTGAGILPFFFFYAIPFALGREPRFGMELAGWVPLALIPVALAYAVVKHRLMDVELIFRRALVYLLATAAIVGICLLVVGLYNNVLSGSEEPHVSLIAILSALVVILLFTPVKARIQEGIERLFYKERYDPRRALLRLSQDLNADLDLGRIAELILERTSAALGVTSMAVFLPRPDGSFAIFRSLGCPDTDDVRLPVGGALLERLAQGGPVNVDTWAESFPEAVSLDLVSYFPCRAKGETIAVLGLGRKGGFDPLNSEEVELLHALAAQAATALVNGRLYRSLQEKAEELQRLTEYNENILESMESGILVLDLEGQIARWNRAMETLYRKRREEVLGRAPEEVFPEAFLGALRGSLVLADAAEIAHIYKLNLPTPDGRNLLVNVSVAPFQMGAGERHGTVLILDDVTVRIRLEEQLQHSEKMASIGLLAAGVAHEVNTPLTGISSYTQMLREQVKPEDLRYPLLEKIERQAFRAAKIINNLLNFSRSGSADLETVDVNRVLLDVLSLLEHQLERNRVKVVREFSDGLPVVRGNENRLQQVFFNLILNARDAMPSGGWLTLATRADDDDTVIIEVRDTGVGIRREDIKRIYDPFFTTKGIGRGTGLGLSVSYGIIQEHGGAIFVDSVPGKGTTFQVALPAMVLGAEAVER